MQRLGHNPAFGVLFCFVFSLDKLEGTGILKFADKSKKTRQVAQQIRVCFSLSLSHTCSGPFPSRQVELPEHSVVVEEIIAAARILLVQNLEGQQYKFQYINALSPSLFIAIDS